MNKELTILFIHQSDGSIKTSIKHSDTEFSKAELYMAYSYLENVLKQLDFDWSSVRGIQTKIIKKEEK